MKYFTTIFATIVLALCFTGCGDKEEDTAVVEDSGVEAEAGDAGNSEDTGDAGQGGEAGDTGDAGDGGSDGSEDAGSEE